MGLWPSRCCYPDGPGADTATFTYQRRIGSEDAHKYETVLRHHNRNFGKGTAQGGSAPPDADEFKVTKKEEQNRWLHWRKSVVNTVDIKDLPKDPHDVCTWTSMLGTGFMRNQLKTIFTVIANYQWQRKDTSGFEYDFQSAFFYVLAKKLSDLSQREGPTEIKETEIDDIVSFLDETRSMLAQKRSKRALITETIFGRSRDMNLNGKLVSLWVQQWLSTVVKDYHVMAKAHVNAYLQMKVATKYLRSGIDNLLQYLYLAPLHSEQGLPWFDRHIYVADDFEMYVSYRKTGLGQLMMALLTSCEIDVNATEGLSPENNDNSTKQGNSDIEESRSAESTRTRRAKHRRSSTESSGGLRQDKKDDGDESEDVGFEDPWDAHISNPLTSGLNSTLGKDATFRRILVRLHRMAQVLIKTEKLLAWLWGISAEGGNFFIFYLKRDLVVLKDIHSEATRKVRYLFRSLEKVFMREEQRQARDWYSTSRTLFSRAKPYMLNCLGSNGSFAQTHELLSILVLAAQNHDLADVYQKTMQGIGQFQQWTHEFRNELITRRGFKKLELTPSSLEVERIRTSSPSVDAGKENELKKLLALPPFPTAVSR